MSSRVEQEQAARAQEAERLQQQADKNARDAKKSDEKRAAFGALVRGGQEKAAAQGRESARQAQQTSKQASDGDRAARLARGGVVQQSRLMEQARSFQGALEQQQHTSGQDNAALATRRSEGEEKDRVEAEDRDSALQTVERQQDKDAELARVDARAEGQANVAVDPDGKREQQRHSSGDEGKAPPPAASADAAQGKAPVREVKQIPPELLEKLVSTVHIAVTQKGLREFQIELKDGVLQGALLKISAEDGKVSLRFERLAPEDRRLVEASKGELMRRLEGKGLALVKLSV